MRFRFGALFDGRPTIEIYQPVGATGYMGFGGQTEAQLRAFLTELGLIEARRASVDQADVPLEQIAKIIAPV